MKDFLDKDFLLESDAAKKLFHEYAEKMPICDYHCHLSPKEIYENNQPNNILIYGFRATTTNGEQCVLAVSRKNIAQATQALKKNLRNLHILCNIA